MDSARYLELADRLLAGEGFRLPDPGTGELQPELFRTPGYPVALALASRLPGSRNGWILSLQILADAVAAALCFGWVAGWASRSAGLLAAALFAFDPGHLVYSNLLMADVFCGFFIAVAWALIERRSKGEAPQAVSSSRAAARLAAAGLGLSVAVALRPVVALLWVPLAVRLLQKGFRKREIAGFLAAALIFPVVWSARNARVADHWTLSTAFDLNLALVAAAKVEARTQGLPREVGEERVMERVAARVAAESVPFFSACRTVAFETFAQAPGAAVRELVLSVTEVTLAGERRYFQRVMGLREGAPAPAASRREVGALLRDWTSEGGLEPSLMLGQIGFMVGVWCLAGFGFVTLWRRGQRVLAIVVASSILLVLGPSLVVATGRLRVPVACLIYSLAGIGGEGVVRRARRRLGI